MSTTGSPALTQAVLRRRRLQPGRDWNLLAVASEQNQGFRGERCTGGKKSTQRITLLAEAKMSGTEKFPFLAIGKSKRPRSFKNKEIPIKYKANSKAEMTAKLFEEVLRAWDGRLDQQGCKVLLCLDNFCGHPPELQLDNIQLVFFPPNTTANSQTLDQREPQVPLQEDSAVSPARGHGLGIGVRVHIARRSTRCPVCLGAGQQVDDQKLFRESQVYRRGIPN